MASLELNHVFKMYPNGVKAVNDFSLKAEDKEFVVFVGPSGCGKSTTLRMIAGLEEITSGTIKIGDQIVNEAEPKERDIAMVFQNYALYPHMTVYNNLAFGLKLKHMPKADIDIRVKEVAEILGLTEYLNRKPAAMSGGQRQRVALGRTIVREPKIFLLDEPLSNLDAKLRASMRTEISKLHKKLKTTFIYVTHDQVEAMTMGTKIVVMKDGFVQQIDTPTNLYRYPINKFVAGFIGTPQMNFFNVTLKRNKDKVHINFIDADVHFDAPINLFYKVDEKYLTGDKVVTLGIRCEHVSIDKNKYPYSGKALVSGVEELGIDAQIFTNLSLKEDDETTRLIIKAPTGTKYEMGEIIDFSINLENMQLFDNETEINISPRIPDHAFQHGNVKEGKLTLLNDVKIDLPKVLDIMDGDYEINIPLSAIKIGEEIKCKILDVNKVEDTFVYVLKHKDAFIYLLSDKDDLKINQEVKVDIDVKQLSFKNDTNAYDKFNITNNIDVSVDINYFKKEHVNEKGKTYKVKEAKTYVNLLNKSFLVDGETGFKIYTTKQKKVFKNKLNMHFDAYSVHFVKENGLPCQVIDILDLGKEKFAIIETKINEQENVKFIVSINEEIPLGENQIDIEINKCQFFEKKNDLRIA